MGSPSNDMKSYATADKGITSLEEEATQDHVGEKVSDNASDGPMVGYAEQGTILDQ